MLRDTTPDPSSLTLDKFTHCLLRSYNRFSEPVLSIPIEYDLFYKLQRLIGNEAFEPHVNHIELTPQRYSQLREEFPDLILPEGNYFLERVKFELKPVPEELLKGLEQIAISYRVDVATDPEEGNHTQILYFKPKDLPLGQIRKIKRDLYEIPGVDFIIMADYGDVYD